MEQEKLPFFDRQLWHVNNLVIRQARLVLMKYKYHEQINNLLNQTILVNQLMIEFHNGSKEKEEQQRAESPMDWE
jgi:hypothetical protein